MVEMVYDDERRPVDYRFLALNSAFERQTGLSDALGRTARELVPGHDVRWYEAFSRVAATGEPVRFVEQEEGLGRWFDVSAFRTGDPAAWKVAVLLIDITDRMRAEGAKERRARQLQHLAEIATGSARLTTSALSSAS